MTAQQPPHTHPHRAPLPTPRTATVSRTRPTSTSAAAHRAPIPPHAPKPSRGRRPIDPTATTTASTTTQTNPLFSLPPQPHSLVPRASCGKPDDLLAPPDAQSCPFAKAGLKVLRGMGAGAYGELDGWLEWPPELFAAERHDMQVAKEIKELYTLDESLRTTERVLNNLRRRVAKLKDDEWMYSGTGSL